MTLDEVFNITVTLCGAAVVFPFIMAMIFQWVAELEYRFCRSEETEDVL